MKTFFRRKETVIPDSLIESLKKQLNSNAIIREHFANIVCRRNVTLEAVGLIFGTVVHKHSNLSKFKI